MFYLNYIIYIGKDFVARRSVGAECPSEKCSVAVMTGNDTAEDRAEEGTLYITDCSEKARELSDRGSAVLGWIYEGNRGEDFGFCKYLYEGETGLTQSRILNGMQEPDIDYLERIFRRYKGLPWDILETERCVIRETTIEDVEDFYRIYSEPSITKYMESLYEDAEEEKAYARDYINQVYAFYHFGMWTVVEKKSKKVIGRAGICYREGCELPELGFVIAVDRQGQGLATEVCSEILRYGYEELSFDRILAFVRSGNMASQRVCEKLGMERLEKLVLQGQEHVAYLWRAEGKIKK